MMSKRVLLYLLLIPLLGSFAPQCKVKRDPRTAILKFRERYCGGAYPDEGILNELNRLKPFAGRRVEIFRDHDIFKNPIVVNTNDEGILTWPKKLKTPFWISVYNSDYLREPHNEMEAKDVFCYEKFYASRLIKVEKFTKGTQTIEFEIECDPCVPPAP